MTQNASLHIEHGPRYLKLIRSVEQSIAALERPLTTRNIASGWIEETREQMLASYQKVLEEMSRGPVQPEHYKGWIKGLDHIDSRLPKTDRLLESALAGEAAVRDIQRAEEFLEEIADVIVFLERPDAGEDAQKLMIPTAGMVEILSAMFQRLNAGKYLRAMDFRVWDELMAGCGCTRREQIGGVRTEHIPESNLKVTFLETVPAGRWWARVQQFDRALVDFASRDIWQSD